MKHIISSVLIFSLAATSSIYSYVVNSAGGSPIDFDDFRNKKILIVNIATGSPRAGQIAELQQLQQQFADSLVVIGFPSNSFGNENRSDAEIVQFCQAQYNANFLLASKGSVKGADMQPLYSWLAHQSENGVTDSEVKSDFQKYLIDTNGEILGLFAGSLSPLNQQVISAITGNYN